MGAKFDPFFGRVLLEHSSHHCKRFQLGSKNGAQEHLAHNAVETYSWDEVKQRIDVHYRPGGCGWCRLLDDWIWQVVVDVTAVLSECCVVTSYLCSNYPLVNIQKAIKNGH